MTAIAPDRNPVIESAKLRRELLALFAQGIEEGPQADALRDQMEHPWYDMTAVEQKRIRGLSIDLYAIAEGGPPRVEMNSTELSAWQERARDMFHKYWKGNADSALDFLRQPAPKSKPPAAVPFLQSRCWEKLGDLETSLIFAREAEKHDFHLAVRVMSLLHALARTIEELEYAHRIIEDSQFSPSEALLAAAAIFRLASAMQTNEAAHYHKFLVKILPTWIHAERQINHDEREYPQTESVLVSLLGVCLVARSRMAEAVELYESAYKLRPDSDYLLLGLATARYLNDDERCFDDFAKLKQRNSKYLMPYLALAKRAFDTGDYYSAFQLGKVATDKAGSHQLRSLAYQIIGAAQSMRNQNIEWVRDNFDIAERLDPHNATIAKNRELAERHLLTPNNAIEWQLSKSFDNISIIDLSEVTAIEMSQERRIMDSAGFSSAA